MVRSKSGSSDRHEIVIRLAADREAFETLQQHPLLAGASAFHRFDCTYFDSSDWHLCQAAASLRVCAGGDAFEQVLTVAVDEQICPLACRCWSSPVGKGIPLLEALPAEGRAYAGRVLDGEPLQAFANQAAERMERTIDRGDDIFAGSFERGVIEVGNQSTEFFELGLVLRKGSLAGLLRFVLELPQEAKVRWSVTTRAERAHRLAIRSEVGASKAGQVRLDAALSTAAAFQQIGWHCLGQLLRNYAAVIEQHDAAALHQSRVALRRLRAAFSIFAQLVAGKDSALLKAELKAVAVALGVARDLDVLIRILDAQPVPADVEQADVDELLLQLDRLRARAYAEAAALLQGASFQRLLFRMAAWIEDGDWLDQASGDMQAVPVAEFAARVLRRRRSSVEKAARDLATLGPRQRHRLRIKVKKLRYATDFFASVFPSRRSTVRQKAFSSALETLQDRLGELNDMATGRSLGALDRAAIDAIERAGLHTVLERMLGAHAATEHHLLKAAERASNEAMLVRRFWKKAGS